jgi:small subunit ribosomal protein S3
LGHKVHPTGFRLGIIKGWESRWYADRNYKDLLAEDRKLREAIRKRLSNAGISRIEIERVAGTQIAIAIHTAKPGIVIGKSGESVDRLRQELETLTKKKVRLSILEIRNPEVEAFLVARSIADQLEKRVSFRRAMKQAVQKAMRANAKGIKVVLGGRLGGAEIARVEKESEGSVPLQTLRADIDYAQTEAHTTYGVIGVKVWIYHGDVLPERQGEARAGRAASIPALGERPERERDRERGPRGGDRDRGGRGGAGGRRSGGTGGGAGGAGGERPARGGGRTTSRAQQPGASTAPRRPRAGQQGGPVPEGPVEARPNLPASGPVTPAPGEGHEFPAPTSNENEGAEQTQANAPQSEE